MRLRLPRPGTEGSMILPILSFAQARAIVRSSAEDRSQNTPQIEAIITLLAWLDKRVEELEKGAPQ